MDEDFMKIALKEAEKASALGEVPVGAVLVLGGQVIAKAHNLVEARQDATAHAEMLCLQEGAAKLGNWRLLQATLYCTLEPCAMCAGAMIASRLETLVWGAPDLRQGVHGSWVNLLEAGHPIHALRIRQGICAVDCREVIRNFFIKRREQK